MEDIGFRTPDLWTHRVRYSSGAPYEVLDQASSGQVISRAQDSYRGPRQKDDRGRLVTHAYNLNLQKIKLERAYLGFSDNGQYHEFASGAYLAPVVSGATLYPTYDWDSLYQDALDKLTEKVRGGLDLSVDLAEAGQSIKMFKLMDKVVDYTRVFKRKYGLLKGLGSAFLEYTYGVKPLVSSVFGVADELMRTVMNHTQGISARKTDKEYRPSLINLNTVQGSKDLEIEKSECKRSLTIGIGLDQNDFDLARWTSLNPASIAWELMPLSFVADWAWDLGGYLRNLETAVKYKTQFRGGYITKLSISNVKIAHARSGRNGDNNGSYEDVTLGLFEGTDINRQVLLTYPIPTLPSFRVQLGSSRMLSSASLLTNLLSSGGNPIERAPRGLQQAVQRRARR